MSEERKKLLQEKLKALNERLGDQRARDEVAHLVEMLGAEGIFSPI